MHLIKAESAMLVKQLLCLCKPSGSHPWKNFWRYTLNCAYPDLNMGLRLITSSCTFQLLHRHETASVLQRHAFDAWAEIDIQFTPPPALQTPVPGQNGAKRRPPPGNDQGRTSIHNQVKMKPPPDGTLVIYPDGSYHRADKRRTADVVLLSYQEAMGQMIAMPWR